MILQFRTNSLSAPAVERSLETIAGGGRDDFPTVRRLRLTGTNRDIGRGLAEAARAVHGSAPRPVSDPTVQRARRKWFDLHYPVLSERMLGVGDAFAVDARCDDWDLAFLATSDAPIGCSAVYYPGAGTTDGHSLLARNYDFPTGTYREIVGQPPIPGERPLAADPWVVQLRPNDGYASVVIGIVDLLGAMDGVNEAGLSVALLSDDASPIHEPSIRSQVGLSEQQIVRYLLDTCATVEEAKQALLLAKQYYIFLPCHFLVGDRSGKSFVWEYSHGHNTEHMVEAANTGRLICTNHLLHSQADGAQPPDDTDGMIAGMTYQRWRVLDSLTGCGGVVNRDEIRSHLEAVQFQHPAEGTRTLWRALYDLETMSVDVSFYLHDRDGASCYTDPFHFTCS